MKFVVMKESDLIKWAFDDETMVIVGARATTAVNADGLAVNTIMDIHADNAWLLAGDLPEGESLITFVGDKYLFNGGNLTLNPDFVAPPTGGEE